MCWNIWTSLIGWVCGWSVAGYIFYRNWTERDRWAAIVLFTYSSIQTCEFFIWWSGGPSVQCTEVNKIVTTVFVPLILSLEPLSVVLGGIYVGQKKLYYFLPFYIIWTLGMMYGSYDGRMCSGKSPEGYLVWNVLGTNNYFTVVFNISLLLPVAIFLRPAIVSMIICAFVSTALFYII